MLEEGILEVGSGFRVRSRCSKGDPLEISRTRVVRDCNRVWLECLTMHDSRQEGPGDLAVIVRQ